MSKFKYFLFLVFILSSCIIISPGGGDLTGIKGYLGSMPEPDPAFRDIDNHALNTPASSEKSLGELAAYLIRPAQNDTEKARSIYIWITDNITYNVEGFLQNNPGDNSAQGVLKNRTSVCEGYSNLFLQLAELSGLETVKISGYAKVFGYTDDTAGSNHAWNAVKIDGVWKLVDSTWGAGYMNQNFRFVKYFSEHYFFTNPEQFIYDHFPEEPDWQLLNKPVTRNEFNSMPHLLPKFFILGISIESSGKITSGNIYTQSFRAKYDIALMGKLMLNGSDVKTDIDFSSRGNGYFDINTVLPGPGEYELMLLAKEGTGIAGEYELAANLKIGN